MHRMAAVLKLKRHQKGQKSLNMKASSKKQISNPRSSSEAEFIGLRLQPELKARARETLLLLSAPPSAPNRERERELEESGEVSIFAAAT